MKAVIRIITITAFLMAFSRGASSADELPYSFSPEKDGALLGAGALLCTTYFLQSKAVDPLTDEEIRALDRNRINRFDRSATYNYSTASARVSDVLLISMSLSPLLLVSESPVQANFPKYLLLYGETVMISSGIAQTAKISVQRIRPFCYNDNAPYSKKRERDARLSFYSNHSSASFASAVFISTVYSDLHPASDFRYAVWGAAVCFASTTAYLRYRAGKHYPTDIICGAIAGSAVSIGVLKLHSSKHSISVGPLPEGGTAVSWNSISD